MMFPKDVQLVLEAAVRCGWDHTTHWSQPDYRGGPANLLITVNTDERAYVLRFHAGSGIGTCYEAQSHVFRSPERRKIRGDVHTIINSMERHKRGWVVNTMQVVG